MNRIEIHIERVVLDGVDFGPRDADLLRAALEAELVSVFAPQGAAETAAHRVQTEPAARSAAAGPQSPAGLGREAAMAIHRSVRR